MKITPQTNPFFQTLSVTIRIATSLTPELKLTSIATYTYHLFGSCHVERLLHSLCSKVFKDGKIKCLWVSISSFPQNCSEKQNAPSRLPSPQNFKFERGALSNLVIRKAFPVGLYSTELCFDLHGNLGDFNRITGLSFLFHLLKGLENVSEKHNFICWGRKIFLTAKVKLSFRDLSNQCRM